MSFQRSRAHWLRTASLFLSLVVMSVSSPLLTAQDDPTQEAESAGLTETSLFMPDHRITPEMLVTEQALQEYAIEQEFTITKAAWIDGPLGQFTKVPPVLFVQTDDLSDLRLGIGLRFTPFEFNPDANTDTIDFASGPLHISAVEGIRLMAAQGLARAYGATTAEDVEAFLLNPQDDIELVGHIGPRLEGSNAFPKIDASKPITLIHRGMWTDPKRNNSTITPKGKGYRSNHMYVWSHGESPLGGLMINMWFSEAVIKGNFGDPEFKNLHMFELVLSGQVEFVLGALWLRPVTPYDVHYEDAFQTYVNTDKNISQLINEELLAAWDYRIVYPFDTAKSKIEDLEERRASTPFVFPK